MKESTIEKIKRDRERLKYPYYLTGKYKNFIIELAEKDKDLKDALINETEYTFSIDIRDLYKRFPLDIMKPSRYYRLTRYLMELGITIIIIPVVKNKRIDIINLIKLDDNE